MAAALIVNRAGRPREKIAADVEEGLADIASVAEFALASPTSWCASRQMRR